jgi:hypothetical protein
MGLQNQQNLIAKLYTDPEFRSAFTADPASVATGAGLTPQEAEQIAIVAAAEIEVFADSLVWKRLHEVERLLPITSKLLAGEFIRHFRIFAASFNSTSAKKHLDDAIEFCRFVRRIPGIMPVVADAAKFESAKLEFFGRSRRFSFAVLRHDLSRPNRPRRTFAVWIRFWGTVYRFGR